MRSLREGNCKRVKPSLVRLTASAAKHWKPLTCASVLAAMLTPTPEELRKAAIHYHYLASNCVTQQARQPLHAMAELLEQEAEQQMLFRQRLIASGRY